MMSDINVKWLPRAALWLNIAAVVLLLAAALTRELRYTLSVGFFCGGAAQLLGVAFPMNGKRRGWLGMVAGLALLTAAVLNILRPWA